MTDWGKLNHAYGAADDVPALLARMSPDIEDEVWGELWSCLCHQGTVYSASFAALPALEQAARSWPASERGAPLILAGCIVAADDVSGPVSGSRQDYIAELEPVIDSLHALALESVVLRGREPGEFVYLAQSVLAFEGDQFWGQRLDELVSREFAARCPKCDAGLTVEVGDSGFVVALDLWHEPGPEPHRSLVRPASDLGEVGRRLTEWARAAEQPEVAAQIPNLFGSGRCPSCDAELSVPEAIAAI